MSEDQYDEEDPHCGACGDSGLIFDFDRGTGRRCKTCQSSRVRQWWWTLKFHIGWWWSFQRPFRKRLSRVDEGG